MVATRSNKGITLTELVISSILIGVVLTVVGELACLNTYTSLKFNNDADGLMSTSRAVRRLGEDIRMARCLGNIYGKTNKNWYPDTANVLDPSNFPPSAGWPASPWPANPYVLGPQTLILQQPVYLSNGFPALMDTDSIAGGVPPVPMEYLDTVVYQVIPDPDPGNVGQYLLQVARFSGRPALTGATLRTPINPPQTVLKGIVGPKLAGDPSGPPQVFQYLSSPNATAIVASSPNSNSVLGLIGVSINLETQVSANSSSSNSTNVSVHVERYLKAARNIRLTNQ